MSDLFTPFKFIRQSEAGECGLACLAMIARHYGDKNGLSMWRRRFPLSSRGIALKNLMDVADQMGLHARALKSDIPSLSKLHLPTVLHWNMNHYVVLDRVSDGLAGKKYTILDPATGVRNVCLKSMSECFTGVVLEVMPQASFRPTSNRTRLRLSQLWTRIRGLNQALTRILLLSIILQVVILVTPFYTQLAIDTVLPGSDIDLLNIIVFGFSAILLLNALVTWLRSRLVLSLNSNLSLQTAANLFRHTIYLPTAWFEKRHLGDITTRFASLQPISDLLSRGLVSAVVDGALAITTLALMVMYSGTLAALTCSVVGIYAVLKAASFSSMKFANANVLTAQAAETSAFIENVRGVSAIKVFCQEASRQRIWQNKKTEVVNGTLKLGRLTSAFDATNGFVVGVENLIFIYVAIKMIINGELTLGMVFAFQAYKQNFVGCITRVIDQTINYRMLDVHLDRISDLALEEPERSDHIEGAMPWQSIELDNVSFSYGLDQPPVLKKVSMNLKAGKTTAIVGPSGSGKTTLFKILCGLLQPTSGRVLVDGRPIQEIGIRRYRAQLGVVSQEDVLFAGSVADNIAFFDPDYDIEQVRRCCVLAGIDDDIARMPMKYDTMVGDMGSSLSGGQRQRVLLARAIYKKPSFLMLDEGTAHLDIATEAHILHAIKQLHGGRLFVAHRPETIKSAEVIYELADGVLRLRDTDRFVVAPPPCKREIIVLRKPSPGSVIP